MYLVCIFALFKVAPVLTMHNWSWAMEEQLELLPVFSFYMHI